MRIIITDIDELAEAIVARIEKDLGGIVDGTPLSVVDRDALRRTWVEYARDEIIRAVELEEGED